MLAVPGTDCSALKLMTLAGGENGFVMSSSRGVPGTDTSGVRKGSRRTSLGLSPACLSMKNTGFGGCSGSR